MERMEVYARDDTTADKLRSKIKTFPEHMIEELKTKHGGIKFEFFGTMFNGIELMGLGASSFGKL